MARGALFLWDQAAWTLKFPDFQVSQEAEHGLECPFWEPAAPCSDWLQRVASGKLGFWRLVSHLCGSCLLSPRGLFSNSFRQLGDGPAQHCNPSDPEEDEISVINLCNHVAHTHTHTHEAGILNSFMAHTKGNVTPTAI